MQPREQSVRLLSTIGLCCSVLFAMVLQSAVVMSVLQVVEEGWCEPPVSLSYTVAVLHCLGVCCCMVHLFCTWPAVHWKRGRGSQRRILRSSFCRGLHFPRCEAWLIVARALHGHFKRYWCLAAVAGGHRRGVTGRLRLTVNFKENGVLGPPNPQFFSAARPTMVGAQRGAHRLQLYCVQCTQSVRTRTHFDR